MPHRCTAGRDEWLHERPQIGDETILPAREVVDLPAGTGVLIFKNCHLAFVARDNSLAQFFIECGQQVVD